MDFVQSLTLGGCLNHAPANLFHWDCQPSLLDPCPPQQHSPSISSKAFQASYPPCSRVQEGSLRAGCMGFSEQRCSLVATKSYLPSYTISPTHFVVPAVGAEVRNMGAMGKKNKSSGKSFSLSLPGLEVGACLGFLNLCRGMCMCSC